jgi:L-threonylcarbamoyladenylate synthase
MPRVLTVDPHAPDPEIVAEATRVLLGGGLVAFPTETVYGLGACALDPAAVAKIFVAKGRPPGHPLIVHVLGSSDARELASSWTLAAERLAAFFWPGALTLVVDRGQSVPAEVTGGGSSVAIRATSHPLARALIAAAGPLAAPSANRYQSLSATSAAHVVKSLGDGVDLVLDGGASWAGIESTVVDARGPSLRLLRPGAVSAEAIRALGMELIAATSVAPPSAASEVHESPGQDAKHYAPRAELHVVEGRDAAIGSARASAVARRTALVIRSSTVPASTSLLRDAAERVELPGDPEGFARELFATLHRLDDAGVERIVIEAVPEGDAWAAIADRLRRGSSR